MQELECLHTISVPDYLKTIQLRKEFVYLQFKYVISVDVWHAEYVLAYTNCSSYSQKYMKELSKYNF